ncbi:MAG: hypothetical protein P8164_04295 [Gammaproteobacteria bacterium]
MQTATTNTKPATWRDLTVLTLVYALYILAVTAPIGFIISAIKVYLFKKTSEKNPATLDSETVLIATHYEWLVRTFIFMGILIMASVGLAYYILGIVIAGLSLVWWFYRIIRGAAALISHNAMPATICTQSLCYGQTDSA